MHSIFTAFVQFSYDSETLKLVPKTLYLKSDGLFMGNFCVFFCVFCALMQNIQSILNGLMQKILNSIE